MNNIPKVETTMQHSTVKCNWGKATDSQLSEYTTNCETLLRSDVSLDEEVKLYTVQIRCAPILITSTVLKSYMGA